MPTKSVKPSENPSKPVDFLGDLWLFLFLKSSREDSNTTGKTIMKQLGDLFLIVTGWQLRDLEAISAWQEKKILAFS